MKEKYDDLMTNIAFNLKRLRQKKGVNLLKVKNDTGLQNVYKIEHNQPHNIHLITALILADYFNISIKQLIAKPKNQRLKK
jgi:transcriptional regulator with XRE-family HTH domain